MLQKVPKRGQFLDKLHRISIKTLLGLTFLSAGYIGISFFQYFYYQRPLLLKQEAKKELK